jgi:hypothetical protein
VVNRQIRSDSASRGSQFGLHEERGDQPPVHPSRRAPSRARLRAMVAEMARHDPEFREAFREAFPH